MAVMYAPFGGKRTYMNDYEQQDARNAALNAQLQQQAMGQAASLAAQRGMADVQQSAALAAMDREAALRKDYRDTSPEVIAFNELGGRQAIADKNAALSALSQEQLGQAQARDQVWSGMEPTARAFNMSPAEAAMENLRLESMTIQNENARQEQTESKPDNVAARQRAQAIDREVMGMVTALAEAGRSAEAAALSNAHYQALNNGDYTAVTSLLGSYAGLLFNPPGPEPGQDPLRQSITAMGAFDQLAQNPSTAPFYNDMVIDYLASPATNSEEWESSFNEIHQMAGGDKVVNRVDMIKALRSHILQSYGNNIAALEDNVSKRILEKHKDIEASGKQFFKNKFNAKDAKWESLPDFSKKMWVEEYAKTQAKDYINNFLGVKVR